MKRLYIVLFLIVTLLCATTAYAQKPLKKPPKPQATASQTSTSSSSITKTTIETFTNKQTQANNTAKQESTNTKVQTKATGSVFDVVEQMPSFPGGITALMEYLSKNVRYPKLAQENSVQGRVVVSFVIEKDGSVSNIQVVRSVDPYLDREAVRVISFMPKWIPGKQDGQYVRVKYNIPISFRLE